MRILWLFSFFIVFIWSGINPKDQFTWFLEVSPAIIGFILLCFSYKTFKLTTLTYTLILIHCIILMIGGHYTYAEVPLFDTIKEVLNQDRNNYDKIGHFAQGFVPAIIAREILIRKNIIPLAKWRNFFIVCFCLAFSAFYELVEWWVALANGDEAEAFLGTQGYIWDTQSDMGFALLGSIISLIILSSYHNNQLKNISSK
jgi:putative membrane protein